MYKNLLLVLAFIYLLCVLTNLYKFVQINRSLRKLEKFILAFDSRNSFFNKPSYSKELHSLQKFRPVMQKIVGNPTISYQYNAYKNFENSKILLAKFLDEKDSAAHELKCSFFPFYFIKVILNFSTEIIFRFGYRPSKISVTILSALFSIIVFAIPILADIFSDELKVLIIDIVNHLKNT